MREDFKITDALGEIINYRYNEGDEYKSHMKEFTHLLAEKVMNEYPEYNLTPDKVNMIVYASAVHDLGEVVISDSILLKPAELTKEEYECIKSHTIRGGEMIDAIRYLLDDEYGQMCYEICRYHHERFDGCGYPDGLEGDDIPISAQIVSLVEAFDALISERVYKKAISPEDAFLMIVNGECGSFSPKLLACFRQLSAEIEETAAK